MGISCTRSVFMARTGVHSGLEKHHFHQAEEPRSPDLRKCDQTFVLYVYPYKKGLGRGSSNVLAPNIILFLLRLLFSNSNTKCRTVVHL